jgi:Xaa-Pro dipeptidase
MYKAQERMKLALNTVHKSVQPGMTVSDADNMIRNIISDNDVGARLITRSGYSIGIAFPPSWDEGYIVSLKQGESAVLEEGMTFHIIPWMWGVDGDKTCGISDTIYITDDGCESFFTLDRDFTVKPEEARSSLVGIDGKRAKKSQPVSTDKNSAANP